MIDVNRLFFLFSRSTLHLPSFDYNFLPPLQVALTSRLCRCSDFTSDVSDVSCLSPPMLSFSLQTQVRDEVGNHLVRTGGVLAHTQFWEGEITKPYAWSIHGLWCVPFSLLQHPPELIEPFTARPNFALLMLTANLPITSPATTSERTAVRRSPSRPKSR